MELKPLAKRPLRSVKTVSGTFWFAISQNTKNVDLEPIAKVKVACATCMRLLSAWIHKLSGTLVPVAFSNVVVSISMCVSGPNALV